MLWRWRTTIQMSKRWLSAQARSSDTLAFSQVQNSYTLTGSTEINLDELERLVLTLEETQASATVKGYAIVLRQCANLKSLLHGKRLHQLLVARYDGFIPSGRYLRNLLVEMYGKCGSVDNAQAVFTTILNPNVFSYTMLMLAYGQNGYEKEALHAFMLMDLDGIFPSEVTYTSALSICSRLGNLDVAKQLHWCLLGTSLESSVILHTAACSMYTGCSRLDLAKQVFDEMGERSVVSWNAMLSAYSQNGLGKEARELFWNMELDGAKPDAVTYLCLVEICEVLGNLEEVPRIQRRAYETGYDTRLSVQTSILTFYGKHGNIRDARLLFNRIENRNSICWNAMIGIYAQHGLGRESVELYQRMKAEGAVKPDEITFINVLNGCASLGELGAGRMVHEDIVSHGLNKDVMVLNSLLNMYGRCGSLEYAREVFDRMSPRTGSSWTVMMTQYAEHGQGYVALELFKDMQIEGLKLEDITFVIVLSVCSHLGLLSEGRDLFFSLHQDYGIRYLTEHYGCIVDLLARAGMLELAEEFLELVPSRLSPVSWTSLLNSCRIHGDVERGTRAALHLFQLDPDDTGTYSILEQLYADAGRWDDLAELTKLMHARGIRIRSIPVEEDFAFL